MMFEVSHKTLYRYASPVVQSQHRLHMSPRSVERQKVQHHSLLIEPAPTLRHDGVDAFGNPVLTIEMEIPHRELVIHARSTIETMPAAEIDLESSVAWDHLDVALAECGPSVALDVYQFRCTSRMTKASLAMADYARVSFPPGRPVLVATMDLVRRVFREFKFDPTATDIATPLQQVFEQRRGVCQDFSHFVLACLRAMRVPARYVSGYILTRPPPGQPKLVGADASHAWISVWTPVDGWVDFDPTNGIRVGEEHVTIATGRDYDDVSPIVGVLLGGGDHSVHVAVDMNEIPLAGKHEGIRPSRS